jgi:hypothetical protein
MMNASALLEANLQRVFNERDPTRRRQAIDELYASDATLYEVEAMYSGRDAVAGAITQLLGVLPPTLVFALAAPVLQNHDLAKLLWRGHIPDGKTIVTGTDVVRISNGRIQTIHVFVDPSG